MPNTRKSRVHPFASPAHSRLQSSFIIPTTMIVNFRSEYSLSSQNPLQKLSANFVIPPGSQVVLVVTKSVGDGQFKKPGSVGIVIQSPPHNKETYLIQFADESTVTAHFEELTLRRQEIEHLLQADDSKLTNYIIYRCQVGSKAFGLSNEDSDDDVRGIFLPPADLHWSLYKLPEQVEKIENGQDEVYWELEKFIRLALKANPNILETLWTPQVIELTPISELEDSFMQSDLPEKPDRSAVNQLLICLRRQSSN